MKRKLKCISLSYVLPSDRTLDFGYPKNRCWHTQLNICEKEEFSGFLYYLWYETGAYLSEAGLQCLPIHPDESVVPHVEMR